MTPDPTPDVPDLLADHVAMNADRFDPFLRDAELASSVVVIPQPLGGGVTVVKSDDEGFMRPSAVVS